MKLKDSFIQAELGGETLLVPVSSGKEEFHGVIRLNETAALIVDRLRQDVTEEDLVNALTDNYDVARDEAKKHVRAVLEKLQTVNALTGAENL